ncbi:MAG: flagellar brake protein [Treponemataceae bacterium]|nr:flagellar brake protein [Treponemataceae bacterium]
MNEIRLLWGLAILTDMEETSALFWSVPALDRSISYLLMENKKNGTSSLKKNQDFLTKLYAYRTKIQLNPQNGHGLKDTRRIMPGTDVVILMKAKNGVFLSKVIQVGKDIMISLPISKKAGKYIFTGETWEKHLITVYFMRKDDAAYSFETTVLSSGMYGAEMVLHLAHSDKLVRTQKRKSVRAQCKIPAQMYIIKNDPSEMKRISTQPGLKCLLEDISEDGSLIRIGGKGVKNLLVKLQFKIDDNLIVMGGFVRGVEFNEEKNQSLMHMECISLEPEMRNYILGFVYNVLPQSQKDQFEAVKALADNESKETSEQTTTSEKGENNENQPN